MSARLCKHLPVLKLLHKASPKQRRLILQSASDEFILSLCETNLDHFELAENPNINLYDPVLNVDANLDLFELAVNPNINLYDHVLSVDNNPVVQYGGVLNNQLPACTDTDPDCDDTEHHDGDDTSQPSTTTLCLCILRTP